MARADVRSSAPSRPAPATRRSSIAPRQRIRRHLPGRDGRRQGGGMALNQLLVVMDGIDEPPMVRKFVTNRLNTFLDAIFIVPRKVGKVPLRLQPPRPRQEQIYFIGACNVPIDGAGPGAHPPGPDGPPHLVPHADQGRPAGHLRPVPGEGRPRARPRHRAPPRRARPDHQWLLAVDDRAVLLDGADDRPLRGPAAVRLGRHRRGDDHGRDRAPRRTSSTSRRRRARSRSTRPATPPPGTCTSRRTCSRRGSRSASAAARSATTRAWRRTSGSRTSAATGWATLIMTLGAMAAEHVFYGENSQGVSGDVASATATAAAMVGDLGDGARPGPHRGQHRRRRGHGARAQAPGADRHRRS